MPINRCAARCSHCKPISRREFVSVASASFATAPMLAGWLSGQTAQAGVIKPKGPASQCVPSIKVCFVRREGEYGMRWPGQIYDGKTALAEYSKKIEATARELGLKINLTPKPIYGDQEADAWIAEAVAQKPDGLLVVLLDRQEHAWPTANKAIDTKIPTVVFSPIGTSFTTNTSVPSRKPGCFICSTDDFRQVAYGMKMLQARAKMQATRCLVLRGSRSVDRVMPHLGIQLRYVPAGTFLEEYQKTPVDDAVKAMAKEILQGTRQRKGVEEQDVINGIKSYLVAGRLMERAEADAITMDCLGALGKSKVSLPCIAWSKMNDDGIPAACEADLGAVASQVIVQYLFDRPGFQQDPVAETAREALIGAHCSCPTRLHGFNKPPEPYDILPHHGARDATKRTLWKVGQRVTVVDVMLGSAKAKPKMLISAGEVLDNVSAPPAGGCVVSVMIKLDKVTDTLAYPGFHQLFLYGDFKRELRDFCRLIDVEPMVV